MRCTLAPVLLNRGRSAANEGDAPMFRALHSGQRPGIRLPEPAHRHLLMSDSRPAILVVFPFCLDHVGHGNIQRLLAIARDLAANGYDVDVVYQGNPRVAPVASQYTAFRRVFRVEAGVRSSEQDAWNRRLAAFYAGYELPQQHMRPSAALASLTRSLLEADTYEAVVATYAFTAPLFAGLSRRVLTVCDVQDILHEHADACHQATGKASTFTLPVATEAFLWRQFDVLVAITPEDKSRIRADVLPHQVLLSARHALASFADRPQPGTDDVALYAGSDNQSNIEAVTWLLQNVWPRVVAARPAARLRLAGLICAKVPDALRNTPGVELLGFMEDVSGELSNCGVLVAPYLYGSGLKIKVVEAACLGKAVVTTRGGLIGTGLEPGRDLEVHDDAEAFVEALTGLLGNRKRRTAMGKAALAQARAMFSPEACYAPIRFALKLQQVHAGAVSGQGLSPSVLERVRVVVDHLKPTRVVLWGNGSHTRSLVAALHELTIRVDLIVDGRGTEAETSPEGLPVIPASEFPRTAGDLVVLSSETFEQDMWNDLREYRERGGHVIGLFDPRLLSRDLIDRLSPQSRVQLGAPALTSSRGSEPSIILWDSLVCDIHWWRLCAVRDLAAVIPQFGAKAVVVAPSHVAQSANAADLPPGCSLAGVLEFDSRQLESRDEDGGARGLSRTSELMAGASAHAARIVGFRAEDLVVLMQPSLSECFGLARTLRARGRRDCPTVVLHTFGGDDALRLSDEQQRAYWRLAISELGDATDGRMAIVTVSPTDAAALRTRFDRPVHAIGQPTARRRPRGERGRRLPRLVCLGHVGVPRAKPMLETVAELAGLGHGVPGPARASVGWRSNQGDAPPWANDQWAPGLATMLEFDLLDSHPSIAMRDELADANAIVIVGDGSESWRHVVRQHAAAAGVPVLSPHDSRQLAPMLEPILRGEPVEVRAPKGADAVGQPAEAVMARLIEVATGRAPMIQKPVDGPASVPTPDLVAEMC